MGRYSVAHNYRQDKESVDLLPKTQHPLYSLVDIRKSDNSPLVPF